MKIGSVVTPCPAVNVVTIISSKLSAKASSTVELRDLATHYSAIAGMSAELAADRAGDDDIALLTSSASGLDTSSETAARRQIATFRLTVAGLSQSARLVREELRMQSELGPLLWRRLRVAEERLSAVTELEALAQCIAERDPEGARRASLSQISHSMQWLIREKLNAESRETAQPEEMYL